MELKQSYSIRYQVYSHIILTIIKKNKCEFLAKPKYFLQPIASPISDLTPTGQPREESSSRPDIINPQSSAASNCHQPIPVPFSVMPQLPSLLHLHCLVSRSPTTTSLVRLLTQAIDGIVIDEHKGWQWRMV